MVANGFITIFLGLMLLGVPIAFALAAGGIGYFAAIDKLFFLQNLARKLIGGVNQFPFLAIPLFILAGELINEGGITGRLVSFAHACVGHWRGGLAQVSIMANVMLAGLSGSAAADAAACWSRPWKKTDTAAPWGGGYHQIARSQGASGHFPQLSCRRN